MKTVFMTLLIAASFSSFASVRPFYQSASKIDVALAKIGQEGEVFGHVTTVSFDVLDSGQSVVRVSTDAPCFATVAITEKQPVDKDGNPIMGPTKYIPEYIGATCAQN